MTLHPTDQTPPILCSQTTMLTPHRRQGKVPTAPQPIQRSMAWARWACSHMPALRCACLPPHPHSPPALARFTLWVQSMQPSLGASALPCIWYLPRARHCREVPLKPHRPGSGGPNIPTLQMGNPKLWGDRARSVSGPTRVKGTAGV